LSVDEFGEPAGERGSRAIQWLPPFLWGALVLSLSLLPDAFFYFGVPRSRDARRVHYYFEVVVHVVQCAVFFLLMTRPLRSTLRSRPHAMIGAFTAVLLLSLLNESVQALTPTRMFDVQDIAFDALGGVVGLCLTLVWGGT
jgi:VanZ family protein